MNNQNVHVTVQLVTWNGAKYIPYLFDSLRKQTYTNWSLMVLDNNSDDDTVESIKKEFPDCTFPKEMIELDSNIGFANGHNLLFRRNKSEFVLLLNQDMYLRSDVITNLVESMLTNEKCASVSPRLMRWDFQKVSDLESLDASFTDTVDSMGLKVFRNRRVIEQYRWQNWSDIQAGFHDKRFLEVFGVSGTLPMYRRIFLETLAYHDNLIFDPLYHSYKEDVDLAFRIISAGYSSSVLLQTVAYHDRSGVGAEKLDDISASKNKLQQSVWIKKRSWINHLMTLYKNEYWQNFLLDFPWIFWYELKKLVWYVVFDKSVVFTIKDIWKKRKMIIDNKKNILSLRKISWREMRVWFVNK